MARSKEDILKDRLIDLNAEFDRQTAINEDYRNSDRDRAKARQKLLGLAKEELNLNLKIAAQLDRQNKIDEAAAKTQESISESLQNQIRSLKVKEKINKTLTKEESHQLALTERLQKLLADGKITHERTSKILKNLNNSTSDRLQIEQALLKVKKAEEEIRRKQGKATMDAAEGYVKGIESNMRKIPILGDLMANTLMGPAAQKKLSRKFFSYFKSKSTKKAFGVAAGNLTTALAIGGAGIAIAKKGFELTTKESEIRKDIRRTLGLTNSEASDFRDTSLSMLRDHNSMATTQEEILKASSELQDTYGHMANSSTKLMNSQITLTKGFGLQAQEAETLNVLADATGQSYDEQLVSTVAMAQAVGKVSKFGMNVNKIMAEVANLSASIKATLGGSAAAMAKAVIQAKLMGTTLQQMDGAAENLLNIESSIEAQVTAQLVTGKNINLDRARLYALNNDLVGVARELTKQGIDYASFGKMNRVEQQATAAAMGMQKDEFADMLLKQKMYAAVGADINASDQAQIDAAETQIALKAKAGDAEAKKYIADQKALSVQERMTAAVESIAGFFNMIGPAVIGLGVGLAIAAGYLTVMAIKAATVAGFSIASAFALNPIGATVGLALALAGIGAITGIVAQSVSDGQASSSKGPFTIVDKFGGMAKTATGDGVFVSPNADKPATQPNTNTVVSNNKETNDLLRQLIAKVDQPTKVYIGMDATNKIYNQVLMNRNLQSEAVNS